MGVSLGLATQEKHPADFLATAGALGAVVPEIAAGILIYYLGGFYLLAALFPVLPVNGVAFYPPRTTGGFATVVVGLVAGLLDSLMSFDGSFWGLDTGAVTA